jgi:hypothetical protein
MAFKTESELFLIACRGMGKLYRRGQWFVEPEGLFGVPDLVVANTTDDERRASRVSANAFEMKLRNWKRALVQAYRYRAFADMSHVVLDGAYAARAIGSVRLFVRSNVGLMSVGADGHIAVHFEPKPSRPFSRHYRGILLDMIASSQVPGGAARRQREPRTCVASGCQLQLASTALSWVARRHVRASRATLKAPAPTKLVQK